MVKAKKLPMKRWNWYRVTMGLLASGLIGESLFSLSTPWRAIATNSPQVSVAETQLRREDFYIDSDANIRIFVREVLPSHSESNAEHPILFIHGGGSAGLSNFDLNVPGYSIAEAFAEVGHSVYIMDARGFGQSSPPASFALPIEDAPPAVPVEEAARDIGAVVDWIRSRNAGKQVALVGWATGGHWAGMYASQNNEAVSHLVVLNSLYGVDAPWQYRERFEDSENPGEYDRRAGDRLATPEGLTANWERTIPIADRSQWRDPAVLEAYRRMAFERGSTDGTSLRIPDCSLSP